MQNSLNAFVFVVCGTNEHLETLHFSLKYLKKFTKQDIIILTDLSRNEMSIDHDKIIDVETPKAFNNHQASIYLKTGIHLFLPKGKTYCYLDTDVVAIKDGVGNIFNAYIAPITFAPDHCQLRTFSPYAVNCSCLASHGKEVQELEKVLSQYDKNKDLGPDEMNAQKRLINLFNTKKQNKLAYLWVMIKYALSRKVFHFEDFYFDKKLKTWFESKTGNAVLFDFSRIAKSVAQNSSFKWSTLKRMWVNGKNENVYLLRCNHLKEAIAKDFNIKVHEANWQHWNGGVFLFNDESHNFLNAWHQKTLNIFKLEDWKTRDQGTLIATAWEFGLEKHPTLNKKWNFIADYNNAGLEFKKEGKFTDDYWKTSYQASFVHIYHHWGDSSWDLWNWVEANPLNK